MAKTKGTSVTTASTTAIAGAKPLPEGIVLKRRITLPSLSIKDKGEVRYLAIADEMRISKVPGKLRTNGKRDEPATICTVGDVLTGEVFTWLVPAVCKKHLEQDYPDAAYVGKCFMVENVGKRTESQKYHDMALAEVDATALTQKAAA